jgi:hypothetical protein
MGKRRNPHRVVEGLSEGAGVTEDKPWRKRCTVTSPAL